MDNKIILLAVGSRAFGDLEQLLQLRRDAGINRSCFESHEL